MDYLKPSALIPLVVLFAGCAATPPPAESRVSMVPSASSTPPVWVPSGDLITIKRSPHGGSKPNLFHVFKDDYDCFGIEPQPKDSVDELVIERKEITTVLAQWGAAGSASSCVAVHSFITGSESEFEIVTATADLTTGTCSLQVSSRSAGGKWSPVYSYSREPVDPFWPVYGRHCKPETLYHGSSLLPVPRGAE
jgi:hypothetical protein